MGIAVDFSFSRPTIAQLKAAGVVMVIRYLNGGGKALTIPELASYLSAGIVVVPVFENQANDSATGFAGGAENAREALASLSILGMRGCPIYFAVDADVNPSSAINYFHGINSMMQPSQVGVYGEGALCSLLQTEGLATWFWQSESTSFPGNATTLPITHLQQKFNLSPVPGTDLDLIMKGDVGQYPRPSGPTPHDPPAQPIPTPAPSTQEEEMPLYTTVNGTGWVIATDLSSKRGIPDAPDASNLLATGLYKTVTLTAALVNAIPNA